jgi:cobaltochelatase CobS
MSTTETAAMATAAVEFAPLVTVGEATVLANPAAAISEDIKILARSTLRKQTKMILGLIQESDEAGKTTSIPTVTTIQLVNSFAGFVLDETRTIADQVNTMRLSEMHQICSRFKITGVPDAIAEEAAGAAESGEEPATREREPSSIVSKIPTNITPNPAFRDAVNSMIRASTDNKVESLEDMLAEITRLTNVANDAHKSALAERAAANRKTNTFEIKEVKVESHSSAFPDGKFAVKLASEVFKAPNGKSDFLKFEVPVFEWEHDHPEVPEVDPNYIFNPEALVSFLYALVANKNTWLHGHTGTGKTTFVEQVAARLQWPVVRVNLDNDIERGDFLGQTQLVTGPSGATESKFVEGVLPRAMQNPCIFLIDEMDFGKSGIMYVLQRALEAKGLLITEDGGRLIQPHPLFRIAATANTRGQGDELGCYPGARTQSNALLDRFTVWLNIDYMTEAQESALLTNMFPSTDAPFIKQLVTFAKEIRKAFNDRELLQTISPRSLMSICHAREFYANVVDQEKATKLAIKSSFLQRATEDTVAKVNEISARCFKA